MKQLIFAGILMPLCAAMGVAQTMPIPPVATPPQPAVAPPTGGPNSPPLSEPANAIDHNGSASSADPVTENQARGRLERNGYSQISALTKEDDGTWRGSAMKNGATVHVSVDHLGKVSAN